MVGWGIIVAPLSAEGPDADDKSSRLASWDAGIGGTDWLTDLVKAGKAEQTSFGGYPCRYTAKASDILPLIAGGPPAYKGMTIIGDDYVSLAGSITNLKSNPERIAAVSPDTVLKIEAWDLS